MTTEDSKKSLTKKPVTGDPMDPSAMASLKHWGNRLEEQGEGMKSDVVVDCGWGRLLFGHTFTRSKLLANALRREKRGERDIAFYVREPNVVLSYAPQELFLDPSLTYRLDFTRYPELDDEPEALTIRPLSADDDQRDINRLYLQQGMVPAYDGFYSKAVDMAELIVLVAVDNQSGEIVGAVTGVDHSRAFNDPDNGCSLWALVVDQQARIPAVGEWLSRRLIDAFIKRGRAFLDLSVMHTNENAIRLYQKLGFEQVPAYCIKNKNSINEQWFIGEDPEEALNIYARLITREARRRGIGVEVLDAEGGFFRLTLGGREITCRESLSELTSAIAMSRCDDKAVTRRLLEAEGLRVPEQIAAGNDQDAIKAFIKRHSNVVVKPARGEQGRGIQVGLSSLESVLAGVEDAARYCDKVLIEECVSGEDLRIIVIDHQVVAAAVRRPPVIVGDGKRTIAELVEKLSRRRSAATHGESTIPLDDETRRCVESQGYQLEQVLGASEHVQVRKTANLHTGGTIHDVTADLHPVLIQAAERAARAIDIPVVGMDFMVPDVSQPDYVIIEANERPGLANHEPQPTVERFVDLLFPQTRISGSGKSYPSNEVSS